MPPTSSTTSTKSQTDKAPQSYPVGKLPLADLQKELPITKPTFIIASPILRTKLEQMAVSTNTSIDLSTFRIYTIQSPTNPDLYQKYMLIDGDFYEVHTVSPPSLRETSHCRNSKFIGTNYIEANPTYFLSLPIDPLFIFLPFFLAKWKHDGKTETIEGSYADILEILHITSSQLQSVTSQQSLHKLDQAEHVNPVSTRMGTGNDPQKSNLVELYCDLFHPAGVSFPQLDKTLTRFSKWCDMTTIAAPRPSTDDTMCDESTQAKSQHYFRINYTKLNQLLKSKIATLCAQITATPSLQSFSVSPNPALPDEVAVHKTVGANDNISLTGDCFHIKALPVAHFRGVTKAWDSWCTDIYCNAFIYLSQYVPASYLNYFVGLFTTHDNKPFTLEFVTAHFSTLSSKRSSKPDPNTMTGQAQLQIMNGDNSDDKNGVKRTVSGRGGDTKPAATATPAKKSKANPPPPKGQPNILAFMMGKK